MFTDQIADLSLNSSKQLKFQLSDRIFPTITVDYINDNIITIIKKKKKNKLWSHLSAGNNRNHMSVHVLTITVDYINDNIITIILKPSP